MVPQLSAYISANTAQLFLKWIFVYVKQSFENNYILSWQLIDMASPSFNTICLFTDVWFSKDPLSFTHAYRCLFINAHVSRADCRPLKTFMFWGLGPDAKNVRLCWVLHEWVTPYYENFKFLESWQTESPYQPCWVQIWLYFCCGTTPSLLFF